MVNSPGIHLTISHPPESSARQDQEESGAAKGLPFIGDVSESKDICWYPDIRHEHILGLLADIISSPTYQTGSDTLVLHAISER